MAIMRRLRQHTLPLTTHTSSSRLERAKAVDVWLQRGSHIAQLGLFIFTIWTIYFTVIPLYQKALLDEQIAQKELRLARMETSLNKAYEKIRISALGDYVIHAGAECSGLMIPPEDLKKHYDPEVKKENYAKAVLAIDPGECVLRELDREISLKELRTTDLVFLRREVARLGLELEQARKQAIVRLNAAEATVQANPSLVGEPLGKPGSVARLVLRDMSPQERSKFLTWVAVEAEQYAAAESYAGKVRSSLKKLKGLSWPDHTDNGP